MILRPVVHWTNLSALGLTRNDTVLNLQAIMQWSDDECREFLEAMRWADVSQAL